MTFKQQQDEIFQPALDRENTNDLSKFKIQEDMYTFPYHYIPHIEGKNTLVLNRSYRWGYEHYCRLMYIKELVTGLNPKSLLDVGCGDGAFINTMQPNAERIKGVDLSQRAIAFANAFNTTHAAFECIDAKQLNETFDVVVAIEVLEHIPDQSITPFLQSLYDRTNANGHIILSFPTTNIPVTDKHYRHYNLSLFKEQLKIAALNLALIDYRYMGKKSKLFDYYIIFSHNKQWTFTFKGLSKKIWKRYQKKFRNADENNGTGMIVVLQKSP